MKFDKFMEHCFKILCIVTALIVAVGAVASCTRPLRASAVDISVQEQAGIQEFLDAYAENMSGLDFEINSDSDGNRNVRLQILGKQQIAYNELFQIYDNMDFSAAPDSVAVSGGGSSALYTSAIDGQLHSVVVYRSNLSEPRNVGSSFRYHVCSSDEFDVYYSFALGDTSENMLVRNAPNEYGELRGDYQIYSPYSGSDSTMTFTDSKGYFTSTGSWTVRFYNSGYYLSEYAYTTSNSEYVRIGRNELEPYSTGVSWRVGSYGVSVSIPDASVPTVTPWEYYNDYVLPDIVNNYDIDNIEDYLVFPDGYYPDEPPQPTTNPDYVAPESTKIVPVIVGIPIPIDVLDDLGEVLDVLDILADLLPGGGLQIQIDGVTITFPRDGDSVIINGQQHPLPLPDFQIDGHTINLPDNLHFDFDGVPFTINSDGTITINGDTYNLPIGTPTQVNTEYDNFVYEYEIPTIEKLNIVDAELSSPDLSNYVSGISLVSGAMSDFIDGVGLMPFIVACLSLGAITYVIWKIGG